MRGLNVTIVYLEHLKLICVPKSFYELKIKIKLKVARVLLVRPARNTDN